MASQEIPKTHKAVATPAVRAKLIELDVPTKQPQGNEALVRVSWTASTPLNLHQADGGLLVKHPQILGGTAVGTVVAVGSEANYLAVGDHVFSFCWQGNEQRPMQQYITVPEYLLGKCPSGFEPKALATVPDSFVSAWHTLTTHSKMDLPWPRPKGYAPQHKDEPILVWGGSGSVGQYVLQLLKYYRYANVIATASEKHHRLMKELGAAKALDYRSSDIVKQATEAADGKTYKYIFDCVGNLEGTLRPIAQIAGNGTVVAVMLPVVVRDATDDTEPEYLMEVGDAVKWKDGVDARGVRTHFYLEVSTH